MTKLKKNSKAQFKANSPEVEGKIKELMSNFEKSLTYVGLGFIGACGVQYVTNNILITFFGGTGLLLGLYYLYDSKIRKEVYEEYKIK